MRKQVVSVNANFFPMHVLGPMENEVYFPSVLSISSEVTCFPDEDVDSYHREGLYSSGSGKTLGL